MENEKVVVLQLKLTRNRCLLLLAAAFLCYHPHTAGSETLTLTTYYPAPYGGYVSLLTTGETRLARDGGNVGIGTAGVAPANLLQIAGAGVRGGSIDLRINGRIQTGDGGNAGGVWLNNGNTMFVGQNGANVGFWTAGYGWSLMQAQNGDASVSGNFTMGANGANNQKVYGVCTKKTYDFMVASPNSTTGCNNTNEVVVAHWGDGLARIKGFLMAGAGSSMVDSGTMIGLGQDFGGTMLCCRFDAP